MCLPRWVKKFQKFQNNKQSLQGRAAVLRQGLRSSNPERLIYRFRVAIFVGRVLECAYWNHWGNASKHFRFYRCNLVFSVLEDSRKDIFWGIAESPLIGVTNIQCSIGYRIYIKSMKLQIILIAIHSCHEGSTRDLCSCSQLERNGRPTSGDTS